jgi:hypothetical protein
VYLGKPLKLDHLKVFGCIAYVHTEKSKRNKMELKSFQCMFIGYDDRSRILMFQSFDKKDNS